MIALGLPQARIPLGWATIQGKRIPVEIDMEWMRVMLELVNRTGGTAGVEDVGVDVFAPQVSTADSSDREIIAQPAAGNVPDPSALEMIVQSIGGNVPDKLVVKAGTAAAPSITTESDTDTGVFFPAANQMGAATNGVQRVGITDTAVGIAPLAKLNLDGVAATGDTYLVESAPNVIDVYAGGTKILTITAAGTETVGHVKLEGVTSTGATGTGRLVFDNAPTLTAPNLGTPSALIATNATGTAAGLSVGFAATAGSAPTVGVSGTKTPPASLTVNNGLIIAWS